ncbi:MAG: alginate export family protein, partial [Planctomycetes bacterium]|nr:alginate export family protein [Planctomycetota bacterium]
MSRITYSWILFTLAATLVLPALSQARQQQAQAQQPTAPLSLGEKNNSPLSFSWEPLEEVRYESDKATCCEEEVACGNTVDPCCSKCKKKKKKPNPCATSHKGVFYANDFSYLDDPEYDGNCLGDCLKLNPMGPCGRWGTLDVGGQLRVRYHNEQGMGQDLAGAGTRRFEDTKHDFVLTRLRMYANWKVNDSVRFYSEAIFADVSDDDGTYNPRGIDRNYGDFLNLFVDLRLTENLILRVGRQELLYGVERVVSPLDWANTRRTFEGVKALWKDGDWAVDTFYTHFVPVDPNDLDEADYDQTFYGSYVSYSGWKNASLDVYYLGYDNENAGPITGDFSLHTLGARLSGS